jgi:CheY-like chemotaxis protein
MRKTTSEKTARLRVEAGAGPLNPRTATTVLHIDDDPNDAALLSVAAQKAGAGLVVESVADGNLAIDYLRGSGPYADRQRFPVPALILLDLKMPCADGFEVLKWIRSSEAFRNVKVLILSGSELQEDIRQAYAAGANSYFVKPIGFEALVELMRNINAFWLQSAPLLGAVPPPGPSAAAAGSSLST